MMKTTSQARVLEIDESIPFYPVELLRAFIHLWQGMPGIKKQQQPDVLVVRIPGVLPISVKTGLYSRLPANGNPGDTSSVCKSAPRNQSIPVVHVKHEMTGGGRVIFQ
jgi:hypothetical protein